MFLTGCLKTIETKPISEANLTVNKAEIIARENYLTEGETITSKGNFNENSNTWWFDVKLKTIPPGCNPACVVDAETKKAEINWRCTGLIIEESSEKIIKNIFTEKYPQFADTLNINIDQEIENHVRGSVIFEIGAPGGLFLATKINSQWQIVHEGNDDISCSLAEYDFPKEMLFDCAE